MSAGKGAVSLGKLSPPETSGLLQRDRLFAKLDAALQGGLAWLSAQAGAGKTTLLASWVRSRGLPTIWYQLDEGDADLASFFHFLSAAAGPRRKLPRLSPEHLIAPALFARRYFATLFQSWNAPHVLVFDNYQKLAPDSPLHAIVDIALDMMPRGCLMAVASRRGAPAPLSARLAYSTTTSLGWKDLRFTESESAALADLWGVSWEDTGRLCRATDGWAALQVLLLRLGSDAGDLPSPTDAELVSDYVEREFFAKLPATERRFLEIVALPPFLTGRLASRLTGLDEATSILERIQGEHLLVSRYGPAGDERRYQLHPLLREFLLRRLARDVRAEDARQLRVRAALLLEERGEAESASDLLVEAGAWPELERLACAHAPRLMASGRMQVLARWLQALPAGRRAANPWLSYWEGAILRFVDPPESRRSQVSAYRSFLAAGDSRGAYLSWAAIVESYAAPWNDFTELSPWLDELAELRRRFGEPIDPDVDLPVLNAGLTTFIGAPYNPFFGECLARARNLIHRALPVAQVGPLAWPIALQATWSGVGLDEARALVARVGFDEEQALSHPLAYLFHVLGRIYLEATSLNPDGARAWVARGLAVAGATGVHLLDYAVHAGEAYAATIVGDHACARTALEKMRPLVGSGAHLDHYQVQYLDAGIRLMAGDAAGALRVLGDMPQKAAGMGAIAPTRFAELLRAQALALAGFGEEARAQLSGPRDLARQLPSPITEFQSDLVEAWTWFEDGDDERGLDVLRRALAVGRRLEAMAVTPFWLPRLMTPLCSRALGAGVEVGYVRRLIRARGLLPDSPSIENWPWPIRVFTLGRFGILLDDVPLTFAGKAQKRPLALLKALIALGGSGVSASAAIAAVWEGESGGDERHNLDVAVSRLRKLLRDERALWVQEGKLSLNGSLVWVDALAFENLAQAWESAPEASRPTIAHRALEAYTGTFLADEDAGPSTLGRRERLRSRYLRIVAAEGAALERAAQWARATERYRRAIELEPLAEELYRSLMRCHLDRGENAQALEVFRRCRQMLSVVLGVAPSRDTEALARRCYEP